MNQVDLKSKWIASIADQETQPDYPGETHVESRGTYSDFEDACAAARCELTRGLGDAYNFYRETYRDDHESIYSESEDYEDSETSSSDEEEEHEFFCIRAAHAYGQCQKAYRLDRHDNPVIDANCSFVGDTEKVWVDRVVVDGLDDSGSEGSPASSQASSSCDSGFASNSGPGKGVPPCELCRSQANDVTVYHVIRGFDFPEAN